MVSRLSIRRIHRARKEATEETRQASKPRPLGGTVMEATSGVHCVSVCGKMDHGGVTRRVKNPVSNRAWKTADRLTSRSRFLKLTERS